MKGSPSSIVKDEAIAEVASRGRASRRRHAPPIGDAVLAFTNVPYLTAAVGEEVQALSSGVPHLLVEHLVNRAEPRAVSRIPFLLLSFPARRVVDVDDAEEWRRVLEQLTKFGNVCR